MNQTSLLGLGLLIAASAACVDEAVPADDLATSAAALTSRLPEPAPPGAVPGHAWDDPTPWAGAESLVETGGWRPDRFPRLLADVDADGDDDLVGFGENGVWLSLSTGTSFAPPAFVLAELGYDRGWRVSEHPRMLADVNRDNRADIVAFGNDGVWVALSTGTGFAPARYVLAAYGYNHGWRVDRHPRQLADVDHDGQADIVAFGDGGVWLSLSTGTGFSPARFVLARYGANDGWVIGAHDRIVTDVNHDGDADIVGFATGGVYLSLHVGDGFEQPRTVLDDFGTDQGWDASHVRMVGDINGDDLADIVAIGYHGVWSALGTGTGFASPRYVLARFGSRDGWRSDRHPRFLADLDGDGRQDLVGIAEAGVYRSLATGDGGFTVPTRLDAFSEEHGRWARDKHPRLAADVNGDGLADLVGLGRDAAIVAESRHWQPPSARRFLVRGPTRRCLDVGTAPYLDGDPVRTYDCNRSLAQTIEVAELDSQHNVALRVFDKCIGMAWNAVAADFPLELQPCDGSADQSWVLDGDSIRPTSALGLAVAVEKGRGAGGALLRLQDRRLDDSEHWTFVAVDDSGARPTTGFVRVPQDGSLDQALRGAGTNTVIEIDPGHTIEHQGATLTIPAGVTIRSDRRGLSAGAEIHSASTANAVFSTDGSNVRITGLRLRGPTRSSDDEGREAMSVRVIGGGGVIFDHNDLSDWPNAAIEVRGFGIAGHENACGPANPAGGPELRYLRNFVHHNRQQNRGYGIALFDGAVARIEGNTFLDNRHAIASDGHSQTDYRALGNLVLTAAPKQSGLYHTHDFDVHGHGDPWDEPEHTGGVAGGDILVQGNTFLGSNRPAFRVRGTPCTRATFTQNIVGMPYRGTLYQDAVEYDGHQESLKLVETGNDYERPLPDEHDLAVGDFDGDGRDDLFLATGAAWYFAPGATAEWRFLRASRERVDVLRLGDFDDDGRTDVLHVRGDGWRVSWAGQSPYETISSLVAPAADVLVGDFDGDHVADVFYANGSEWRISYRGRSAWQHFALANHRAAQVRLGDFNGDGKTDVFAVVGGDWSYVPGGGSTWQRLRGRLDNDAGALIVADFDGNGRSDVATSIVSAIRPDQPSPTDSTTWRVSYDGTAGWTTVYYRPYADGYPPPLRALPIGRFNAAPGADVAFYTPEPPSSIPVSIVRTRIELWSRGGDDLVTSRNDMR